MDYHPRLRGYTRRKALKEGRKGIGECSCNTDNCREFIYYTHPEKKKDVKRRKVEH